MGEIVLNLNFGDVFIVRKRLAEGSILSDESNLDGKDMILS